MADCLIQSLGTFFAMLNQEQKELSKQMKCTNCQTMLPNGVQICPNCGLSVVANQVPTAGSGPEQLSSQPLSAIYHAPPPPPTGLYGRAIPPLGNYPPPQFSTYGGQAPGMAQPQQPPKKRHTQATVLITIGIVFALFVGSVGGTAAWVNHQIATANATATAIYGLTPADASILTEVTSVSQATWQAVGKGSATDIWYHSSSEPALAGPHGHPELFFVGDEFCAPCAAERWAMVNALSRFGMFTNLKQMESYEGKVPTFSFYKSSFSSSYLDFVPIEALGNDANASTLQPMTAEQQALYTKYDTSAYAYGSTNGGVPFLDLNNAYFESGAAYNDNVLFTHEDPNAPSLSITQIAGALSNPASPIARNILGAANSLTAVICLVTKNQPANVCQVSVIQQIELSLR